MLKRIYVDNFRCLVDFELCFDDIHLFLGPNGAGKSTVFEVLRKIQAFVSRAEEVAEVFEPHDLTRFMNSPQQTFELEIEGNGGRYKYELAIRHEQANREASLAYERLSFNDQPLLKFESGAGQLYLDDQQKSVTIPGQFSLSAVAFFASEPYSKLTWFKERMMRFMIVKVIPPIMEPESSQQQAQPSSKMENFISWYRYVSKDSSKARQITDALKEVFEDFDSFKFVKAGEQHRVLNVRFVNGSNGHKPIEYRFGEIADGDRALIALYSLIHYARFSDVTLCIDEPENFLALAEIQPWLMELYDFCSDDELQTLLISHHPDLIDFLALSRGYWFERDNDTPTRARRLTDDDSGGFPMSKLVARGWIHG